jgi:hypothetical protein
MNHGEGGFPVRVIGRRIGPDGEGENPSILGLLCGPRESHPSRKRISQAKDQSHNPDEKDNLNGLSHQISSLKDQEKTLAMSMDFRSPILFLAIIHIDFFNFSSHRPFLFGQIYSTVAKIFTTNACAAALLLGKRHFNSYFRNSPSVTFGPPL